MTDWLSTREVASIVGCHYITVARALECGELHGHQRYRGGRWRIHPDAPDAWVQGGDSSAPCGCSSVTPFRRPKGSAA